MVRVSKLPAERQDEILDAAQRLFWARGYANTPVQALIDEVGIAKGTFYHHYPSKDALLEALVGRMVNQAMAVVQPLVDDPSVGAIEKMNRLFRDIGAWKSERKDILIELHRAMHSEANMPLYTRLQRESTETMAPQLGRVVAQGVAEGVFDTRYPTQAARVVLELGVVLGRALGEAILGLGPSLSELGPDIDAFHDAVERVLGAPAGSLQLLDRRLLAIWLGDEPGSSS